MSDHGSARDAPSNIDTGGADRQPAPRAASAYSAPSAVSADLLAPPGEGARYLSFALIALVATFIAWSALAAIVEVTTGRGKVVPASKIQLVQNLEGGIVREILVREGQQVAEGDVILRIDPTIAGASLGEAREKAIGLKALIARLEAEVEGTVLTFQEEVLRQRPDLAGHQRDHYETRKRELDAALSALALQEQQRAQEILELEARITTLQRSLTIAEEELQIVRPLEKSKAASRSEVLAAEAKVNDIAGSLKASELALPRARAARKEAVERRDERISAYRGDSLQKLAAARVELAAFAEAMRSGEDKLARTTIRAPASGIVKTVHVTTTGQVVQPGHNLVEIVPLNDTLLVEAQIRPQDIAFLSPGLPAIVKLTAYDFSVYGGLDGRIEHIGADSITNERGETYYLIQVRTDRSYIQLGERRLPIIPGMVADVDVITGSKTVLAYLTRPLTRIRSNALREK
jgi:adhesin transport system membrane fusion protein